MNVEQIQQIRAETRRLLDMTTIERIEEFGTQEAWFLALRNADIALRLSL